MSNALEMSQEERAPIASSDLAPKFLFKFHRQLSQDQVEFVRNKWDEAARTGKFFGLGPEIDLYQLVDGRYVAVTTIAPA